MVHFKNQLHMLILDGYMGAGGIPPAPPPIFSVFSSIVGIRKLSVKEIMALLSAMFGVTKAEK